MFRTKACAALFGLAVIAGVGTYLVQQRQVQRLEAENQSLLAQQAQALADQDAAAKAAQAVKDQLERLRKDNTELLRLRKEVTQLRRERDARKQTATEPIQPSTEAIQLPSGPGRYISKEQMTFAGYATPDAALESTIWTMMNGTYEQVIASLGEDLLKHESEDPKGREDFETGRKMMFPAFKGMQVLARKTVREDRIELKVRMDAGPLSNGEAMPPMMIQPMVKVGNEWKQSNGREYEPEWDDGAQTQE